MFDKIKNFINGLTSTNKETTIIDKAETIVKDKVYSFKVAGISFHYNELNKIIKSLLNAGTIEKFCGYTNQDIIESNDGMTIFEHQYTEGVKLEPYKYEGKNALKILLSDNEDKWYEVGSVPKKDLQKVFELLDTNITKMEFEITGGKAKYVSDSNHIVNREYEYGVNIYITYEDV